MLVVVLVVILALISIAFVMAPGSGVISDEKAVELVATLFSSATFGLFLIASALGAMTLMISFYGRKWLEEHIDARVEKKVMAESRNLTALVYGMSGLLYAELAEEDPAKEQAFRDKARRYAKNAHNLFAEEHRGKMVAKNNYIFAAAKLGHVIHAPDCVEMALDIRRNCSDVGDYNYLLTYAQVVLSYHRYFERPERGMTPEKAIADAIETLDNLLTHGTLPEDIREKTKDRRARLQAIQTEKGFTTPRA